MRTDFIDLNCRGKNAWWRYLAGILFIVFFWALVGGGLLAVIFTQLRTFHSEEIYFDKIHHTIVGISALSNYLILNLPHLILLMGLFLAIRLFHRRSFVTLITAKTQISWKLIFKGFSVYLILMALASFVENLFYPSSYFYHFDFKKFIPFALVALVITPLQTTAEELLFRGYLVQALGKLTRSSLVIATASGFLFMIPHLTNPEMRSGPLMMAANYYLMGFFLATITLRSQSLELAIGAHAANNLFVCLGVNYSHSILNTESVFITNQLDPVFSFFSIVFIALSFYFWFFGRQREIH